MEGLAELRPFVCFCHAIGFIPFRMKTDQPANKSQRFTFQLNHGLTWWFAIIQAASVAGIGFIYYQWFRDISTLVWNNDRLTSHDYIAVWFSVVSVLRTLDFVIVRFVMVRCSELAGAVELIDAADETLQSLCGPKTPRNAVTRRVYVGIALILALMACTVLANGFLTAHSSLWMAAVVTVLELHVSCWLLLYHLGYYILADRVRMLRLHLTENASFRQRVSQFRGRACVLPATDAALPLRREQSLMEKLRTIQDVLGAICRAAARLNSFNSGITFLIFSLKIATMVVSLCILLHFTSAAAIFWFIAYGLMYLSGDIIVCAIVLTSPDLPVIQVTRLRHQIMNLPKRTLGSDDEHIEVMAALMKISEDRVQLVAGRMFSVGIFLVPGIVGTVITYVVNLVTFK